MTANWKILGGAAALIAAVTPITLWLMEKVSDRSDTPVPQPTPIFLEQRLAPGMLGGDGSVTIEKTVTVTTNTNR